MLREQSGRVRERSLPINKGRQAPPRPACIPLPESDDNLGAVLLDQRVDPGVVDLVGVLHLLLFHRDHLFQETPGRVGQHPGVAGTHETRDVVPLKLLDAVPQEISGEVPVCFAKGKAIRCKAQEIGSGLAPSSLGLVFETIRGLVPCIEWLVVRRIGERAVPVPHGGTFLGIGGGVGGGGNTMVMGTRSSSTSIKIAAPFTVSR